VIGRSFFVGEALHALMHRLVADKSIRAVGLRTGHFLARVLYTLVPFLAVLILHARYAQA